MDASKSATDPNGPTGRLAHWVAGASGSVARLPDLILDTIAECGVMPRLAAQGYLPAELGELLRSSAVAMRGEGSGA
jgi:3-isopropylmalate/(R)-2-methylmalate dehydratase small subunit